MITAIVIITILVLVLLVAFLALATQAAVSGSAAEFIAAAEKTGATGAVKMAQVVAELGQKVPTFLKTIFTDERLQAIAQGIFVWMRKYAEAYNKVSQEAPAGAKEPQLNRDALVELLSELMGLGLTAIQEKAKEYGVEITRDATKEEIAKAIIEAAMSRS